MTAVYHKAGKKVVVVLNIGDTAGEYKIIAAKNVLCNSQTATFKVKNASTFAVTDAFTE